MPKELKPCPMRHENGNCLVCGGFCTSVIKPICEAVHNAYNSGYNDAVNDIANWLIERRREREG